METLNQDSDMSLVSTLTIFEESLSDFDGILILKDSIANFSIF